MKRMLERRTMAVVAGLLLIVAAIIYDKGPSIAPADGPAQIDTLPYRLTDSEFWNMIEDFSEPDGYFQSDNFLSNEWGAQEVIPKLRDHLKPGGVYLGVGPEQNFTYIQAFQPKMAFIVDIRRLNMVEHLLYKALFERASSRSEFVSLLFSRAPSEPLSPDSSPKALFETYGQAAPNEQLFAANVAAALSLLTEHHGFRLTPEDEEDLRYVYNAFFQAGPDLSYSFLDSYIRGPLGNMPTYSDLMQETDGDGRNWGFLASEEQFQNVQQLQKRNLIVPIVGDFAGPKAIRAIGRYLKQHYAPVRVFYTSNVEMYLFRSGNAWKMFYGNVGTLPVDSASSFVRFALGSRGSMFGGPFGSRRSQMWSSIPDVLEGVRAGTITSYRDVVDISR